MASYSLAPVGWPTTATKPALKLQPFIRKAVTNSLDDVECHADEWVLPIPFDLEFPCQARSPSTEHQFECTSPSPLIHDMSEEHQPQYTECLSSSSPSSKRSNSEGGKVLRSSFIPIPQRIRKHRRTDSEIMVRLTDSDFELGLDGRVLVITAPDYEIDELLLPAAVDALSSRPAAFFSPSTCSPSTENPESYSALISKEIQARSYAKKRLEELDNNNAKIMKQKGAEALRRMLWGEEISDLYPVECARDFS